MPGPFDRVLGALRPAASAEGDDIPPRAVTRGEVAEAARQIAESLSEGVLWVDAGGRIREVNAAACWLLTSLREDLIGQTLLEATHLRPIVEINAQTVATGDPRAVDVRLVGPVERALQVRTLPVGDGSVVVLEDYTELMRLRTVRTEFVANVSHELRTPLASIRATAETLLDGAASDPEMAPRFLETIIREADRLVRLSEDLLDLARAESTDRDRSRFDLRALIADVIARLSSHAEKRGVSVTIRPAPTSWVDADRDEISQVLFNLLDNAIKYTPSGGQVTIELTRRETLISVSVTDTGIGILSQDLPRIFERFWRADRARRFPSGEGTGVTSGTGLGLSIVKHIVEAHGGTVTAESELNRGSCFTFTLPVSQDSL